jgi:two-component system, OmpR family, sensor histidine kinase QseC
MKLFQQKSLQARLLTMVLATVSVMWLAAMVLTLRDTHHEIDEILDGHLAQVAALLVFQQIHDDKDEDNNFLEAPSLHKYAPKMAFQIFRRGELVNYSATVGPQPMSIISNGFDTVILEKGDEWRVFAMNDATQGVQVYVGELTQSRFYVLKAVLRGMLIPFLIALPLLALLMWWVVRRGLAPLRELSEGLLQRKPQALQDIQLSDDVPSEIRPMVQALNGLFERIELMLVSERRFTADAAHELRTPIAAIRTQAQVALGAGAHTVERDHALRSTLAGCDRATRLVEQLLTLARLEAASEDPAKLVASVDLCVICRRVIAELVPAALARQQILELAAPNKCLILGDDLLVGVLVRNLIDNALRYSKDGSRVFVYIGLAFGLPILRVEDSGEGMTEPEIARLGERFFRVLGHEQPGSGLGWSIVSRISKVFGATLNIGRSTKLGGLSVTVRWVGAIKRTKL